MPKNKISLVEIANEASFININSVRGVNARLMDSITSNIYETIYFKSNDLDRVASKDNIDTLGIKNPMIIIHVLYTE